jgi:hypothetical protein
MLFNALKTSIETVIAVLEELLQRPSGYTATQAYYPENPLPTRGGVTCSKDDVLALAKSSQEDL